jgi:hypothetical protein
VPTLLTNVATANAELHVASSTLALRWSTDAAACKFAGVQGVRGAVVVVVDAVVVGRSVEGAAPAVVSSAAELPPQPASNRAAASTAGRALVRAPRSPAGA